MTDDHYTRIRPAREHDGLSLARWFFYRTRPDGSVVREPCEGYGFNLDSPYLYFVYEPTYIDPPDINALPPPDPDRGQYGRQQPKQPGDKRRGRPRKEPA